MSDPSPDPIVVHASPTPVQIEAGFRQIVIALGSIIGALGYSADDQVSKLLAASGAISAIVAFIWGQVATRIQAAKAAEMAQRLPDHVAQVK